MTLRRFAFWAACALGLSLVAFLIWWLFTLGFGVLTSLIGDWRQFVVALMAAGIMGAVGVALTMGRGRLAAAGQYEKIAVWAALILSIVSAITTSTGLMLLLSANPRTGSLLMVGMALMIGLGIQLSMLMYALRIGDGLLQITRAPRQQGTYDEDEVFHAEPHRNVWPILAVIGLLGLGCAMVMGFTGFDILKAMWTSVLDKAGNPDTRGTYVLGPILVVLGLALAMRYGMVRQPATVIGVLLSLGIYGLLLIFSSGFGYLSYFLAAQSEEVLAIDRDNHIETRSFALVQQIRVAAADDAREALTEARSGDAYVDLSGRIGKMAELFVREEPKMQAEIERAKQARARAERALEEAQTRADRAGAAVQDAAAAIDTAKAAVARAEQARTRQSPGLEASLTEAEAALKAALRGDDGSGVAACGPNCRSAKRQIQDTQAAIDSLDLAVDEANTALRRAESNKVTAERTLGQIDPNGGGSEGLPVIPIVLTDRASFTQPMSEYDVDPTKSKLAEIARTCATARNMLTGIGVSSSEIPLCGISEVEVWLTRHAERQDALGRMQAACSRTEDEIADENAALFDRTAPNPQEIPAYLRSRLALLDRCLTAANTGSPRLVDLADQANRLESEYTTAGYDVRRVLGSLLDGNRFARFAILMALIVDTAILVAGFAANAYRGRDLAEDQRLISPDRIDDRIAKTLEALSPGAPHLFAMRFTMLWEPRPFHEIGDSPFTHRLRLDRGDPEAAARMRLVLDAAGPSFARFSERKEDRCWILHNNLVALLIGRATANPQPADLAMPSATRVGLRPGGGSGGVKPHFRPRAAATPKAKATPLSLARIEPGRA